MRAIAALLVLFTLAAAGPSAAQDRVWIQVEAHRSLVQAERRVRAYAQLLQDVNGYTMPAGWYGIALGPYTQGEAEATLTRLLNDGLIPRDSYLETGGVYRGQFWPIGADTLSPDTPLAGQGGVAQNDGPTDRPSPVIEATEAPQPQPAAETAPEPVAVPEPEETLAEARRSESALTREERDALQIALAWDGYYTARIDGAFGPGTRRAMTAWQEANGLDPTGVLTTRQRALLLRQYREDLASYGFQTVRDTRAGVEIELPTELVTFARYDYPFAHYEGDDGIRVLLISQAGDRATLFGLYDIMQTLEIVPLDGERERDTTSFVLTGQDDDLRSHTEARLAGGQVKGFSLVWTPEADDRAQRILARMQDSFRPFGGTLDPAASASEGEQSIDLLAGLEIRRPEMTRSGFFIDPRGAVATTTEVLGECRRILIDEVHEARVVYRNDALGFAVLRANDRLAPLEYARFAATPGRLRDDVAVAGFPFDGALGAASMSFGTLAELRGLDGAEAVQRLEVATSASEAGGPVLDRQGAVLGMVLPGEIDGRRLPDGVSVALRSDQVAQILSDAGLTPRLFDGGAPMARDRLARLGADMTVTVSCWN